MSLTKVSYSTIQGAVYNALDYGISTSSADNASAISALITTVSSAGGGTIYFPTGIYNIRSAVDLKENVTLRGNGKSSVIKATATGGYHMFNAASVAVNNVVFDGLAFDGSANYPANDITTKPSIYANWNVAIRTGGFLSNNLKIVNCYFYMLAGGAIDINADSNQNIVIQNNEFYKANYRQQIIYVRSTTTAITDALRPNQILIDGNTFFGGGPQSWYDPSDESWAASLDAIVIDRCKNFVVSNNSIKSTCGIGIRIEQSIWGNVTGNDINNVGSIGITCYKDSYYISVVGNTVQQWGRIPSSYSIRSYSGTYVYAKEFPDATYAVLPANPTASSWFGTWPYSLTNVDTTKIITYSNTQYYGTPNGILPWRGLGGICVNQESANCVVVGNTCFGDTTLSSGKYIYSANFGYTDVHPTNSDSAVNSGNRVRVSGNYFGDVIEKGIYAPIYQDPINAQGVMGIGEYNVNYGASEEISTFTGIGRFSSLYFNPQVSMTTGTGSPEGVLIASPGALYLNLSGGTSTTLYVKTSGTGNTGWTAK
jgi:hypothetical protein